MMIRWKCSDLTETTIDGLEEITLISHGSPEEPLREDFILNLTLEVEEKEKWLQDYNYSQRGPINGKDKFKDMKDSKILILTRKEQGIPTLWEITCAMAWILDDDGNTIDRLCC